MGQRRGMREEKEKGKKEHLASEDWNERRKREGESIGIWSQRVG